MSIQCNNVVVSLGSDHWDAGDRGGSEIHGCAGARSLLGQCKFSIVKSVLLPDLPVLHTSYDKAHWNSDQSFGSFALCNSQDDGGSESKHQLPVAGKIKKNFNTGPKLNSTTAGVSVITVSAAHKNAS